MAETTINHGILTSLHGTQDFSIAMLIYLVMTSLIFAGSSAYCFLLYARRYLATMLSFRLFCRRLIANFTEDGLRGNV